MSCPHKHVDEAAVATAVKTTPLAWRSLDERQQTAEFEKHLHREFAPGSSEWFDSVSRRNFLKVIGASVALAGAAGCVKYPEQAIVPYVQPPSDDVVAGRPMFYATAMPFDGHAWPMIATAHEGRPTKVDGNPDHPASLGSSTAIGQASILQMYDPERSQVVMYAAQATDWSTFQLKISAEMAKFKANGGTGLRFLATPSSSPTLAKQIADFQKMYPNAKWHNWEACANHGARQASVAAFGKAVNTIYKFDQASRILSLDSNFCIDEQGSLIYARQFINGRRLRRPEKDGPVSREIIEGDWQNPQYVESGNATMNRLYMVETNYTSTGAMADHRLPLKPSQIEDFARAVAAGIGVAGVTAPAGVNEKFLQAVLDDLKQAGTAALVIPGRNQPAAVHILAHAINQQLGAVGKTVIYTDPVDINPVDHVESIRQLASDMEAGQVDTLIIMDGNPVYDAPADLNFADLLNSKVRLRIRFGLYYDETSFYCHWQLPASHYLESWSDARGFDGTIATIQPLILPLYQSKSAHELLALLSGDFTTTAEDILRNNWKSQHGDDGFEDYWQTTLCKGVIDGSTAKSIDVTFNTGALNSNAPAARTGALEVSLPPDSAIWDGTWSTNGWLQELPRAITKLVWDNAALISPATAAQLGLESEGLLQLKYTDGQNKEQTMTVAVWVVPGHADNCATLNLGYGRKNVNAIGGVEPMENLGFNAYPLRKTANLNFTSVTAVPAKGRYPLSSTQLHQNPEGRDLVRFASGTEFAAAKAEYAEQEGYVPGIEFNNSSKVRLSLYPEFDYAHGHRWGMVIDDNACVGCNACVMACQSENNIPVVGKDQVARYREMHWLRIDSWHFGDEANPITVFEPVACQMCEHAPCEVVCPVNATTHSYEGLNEMTYNRCVGTRYCSNNCPYKVRRFNFLRYNDYYTPSLKLMRNPTVSVRERGVMEKCTYCVQRIDITRIDVKRAEVARDEAIKANNQDEAKVQQDNVHDLMMGLQTACQQSCPTEAIFFGDMNYKRKDPKPVRIVELKNQQPSFGLLTEYNTQPRTSYMNRFRNPNPALEPQALQYPPKNEEAEG